VPSGREWLDDHERQRGESFHFEHDRRRFLAGHILLRDVLARYRNCDPDTIRFEYGPHGKPSVPGFEFNLSHADDLGLLAIRRGGPTGVDVERVDRPLDHLAIANKYFSPDDARDLSNQPADQRSEHFFRLWTRREAVLKAFGLGVAGLDHFAELEHQCTTHAFIPEPGYVAALALVGYNPSARP
jgi:4'-phosphopantetheinyl transferase